MISMFLVDNFLALNSNFTHQVHSTHLIRFHSELSGGIPAAVF